MKAVIAEGLTKIYSNQKKAVDQISFTLEQGEVFGFLGPNGAGKTTTVKMLNGMAAVTGGTCEVLGMNPYLHPAQMHQLSGVVTEHAQMYDNLSGLANLIFYGTLFGANQTDSKKRALDLLEKLGLTEAKDQKLGTYSTGMRQRLSLARAMIHSPRILFLDEPTSGLDPESALSVNRMVKSLAEDTGLTIFLCTHQLRYAQEICNTYGLINGGTMLAAGDLENLRSKVFSGLTVNIKADRFLDRVAYTKKDEQSYEFQVQSEEEIPTIINQIVADGGNIYHVVANKLTLEEIYLALLKNDTKIGGNKNA